MIAKEEPIRLLMVDDEKEFLEASAKALERRGFVVSTAFEGSTALDLIASQLFDAVVLDIKMPGLDGVEVFHLIKKSSPHLPIVMLTGHGNIQQAFETSKDGVFAYLAKPCSVERMIDVVKSAIQQSSVKKSVFGQRSSDEVKLMVIDDERDRLELLGTALRHGGIQVTGASNTEEAFRLLERCYFDVVVVDMELSKTETITLVKHIKQVQPLTEMIFITAQPSAVASIMEIKNDLYDVLVKPLNPNWIAEKVKEAYVQRKQNQQEEQKRNIKEILEGNPD